VQVNATCWLLSAELIQLQIFMCLQIKLNAWNKLAASVIDFRTLSAFITSLDQIDSHISAVF